MDEMLAEHLKQALLVFVTAVLLGRDVDGLYLGAWPKDLFAHDVLEEFKTTFILLLKLVHGQESWPKRLFGCIYGLVAVGFDLFFALHDLLAGLDCVKVPFSAFEV